MFDTVIGIEIHALLNSKTKAFTNGLNNFDTNPNTNVVLGDIAYPGTLPTLNKEVVDMALKVAIALNCKINKEMHFDRKNYFYPDLSKGYQITQNLTPIGYDGYIEVIVNDVVKKIEIERIHIEEDTCKSTHTEQGTLLDFNRSGVPLIEIVTKPVIYSADEAMAYIEAIREVLLYLEVSDVKIEEGSMRCDVNISLKEKDSEVLGTKVEIKNIGSISNAGIGIDYEVKRQSEILNSNELVIAETRRFDDSSSETVSMREKVNSDYRYYPEPNIPYIKLDDEFINEVKNNLPALPSEIRNKYKELGINQNNIKTITNNYSIYSFFEKVVNDVNPVISANILTGDVISYLNKNKLDMSSIKLTSQNFKELVQIYEKEEISSKQLKDIIPILLSEGGKVAAIIDKLGIKQISDEGEVLVMIKKIIDNNPQSVEDFKAGQDRALKYLMGQVMKESKGQINPALASKLLTEELNKY